MVGALILVQNLSQLNSSFSKILGFASNITVSQVVDQTNQERQKIGLEPLSYNKKLSDAALAKGQDMFNDQYWAHTAPDGTEPWYFIKQTKYNYIVAGENLARDFSSTPDMVTAWMASPTHKANILNPKYQEIGIAVIDGILEGYETTLVVQMFGTQPNGQVPSIISTAQVEQRYQYLESEPVDLEQNNIQTSSIEPTQTVLASMLVPIGQITGRPLLSPLQLSKAIVIFILVLITVVLIYDLLVIGHKHTMRLVGKNLAHLILLITVLFLVIYFKGGMIG